MEPVVQWVRTSWTKVSRGGTAAARRNAAPTAFPHPAVPGPFLHSVVMREADGFIPDADHHAGLPERDDVELRSVGDRLRVLPVVPPSAAPRRDRRPPAVLLKPGEWLRWHLNYRFPPTCSCGAEWTYRLDTLNIAHGPVAADLFLGEPQHLVDERGFLR